MGRLVGRLSGVLEFLTWMSLALGTILRTIAGGLWLLGDPLDFGGDVAGRSNTRVSWEFAIIIGIRVVQRRPGLIALVSTFSLIAAVERGGKLSLTLGWIRHWERTASELSERTLG